MSKASSYFIICLIVITPCLFAAEKANYDKVILIGKISSAKISYNDFGEPSFSGKVNLEVGKVIVKPVDFDNGRFKKVGSKRIAVIQLDPKNHIPVWLSEHPQKVYVVLLRFLDHTTEFGLVEIKPATPANQRKLIARLNPD